VHKKDVQRRQL